MSISDSDARARMVVLFSERSEEIAQILKEAGVDPARDFRHRNFASADFGRCDVARWDFSGSILRNAKLAGVTFTWRSSTRRPTWWGQNSRKVSQRTS